MDKQKQVEEMAKVVQRDMCGDIPCEECNYHGKMKILPRYCGTYLIAEMIYNAGYRKIPENAVVLTREEYEIIDHNIKHLETVCNNLEKERNELERNYEYNLVQERRKIRKETAIKFAEKVNQAINAYKKKVGEDEYVVNARRLIFEVNEICKDLEGNNV